MIVFLSKNITILSIFRDGIDNFISVIPYDKTILDNCLYIREIIFVKPFIV